MYTGWHLQQPPHARLSLLEQLDLGVGYMYLYMYMYLYLYI